jgi:hypothetical protein
MHFFAGSVMIHSSGRKPGKQLAMNGMTFLKDPFDRMLIAQAQGLTLVTRDKHFPLYGVRVLPADL